MKTITVREVRWGGGYYSIFVEGQLWYEGRRPPEWNFWLGMMQEYGPQLVEVVHEIVE